MDSLELAGSTVRSSTTASPLPDFPVEVLPARLRCLVDEVSASRNVPAIIPASGCLAAVAASLGRGLVIRNGDRVTYPNLFLAVSARTGFGKGSAEPAIQPFRQFQDVERIRWRDAIDHLLDPFALDFEGSSTIAPSARSYRRHWGRQPPTLITEDATGAGLELLLAENLGLTFMFSSEAGVILDAISKPNSQLKRLLLKGFSVEPYDSARASRTSVHLPKPCITGLWLTQPHRLEKLFQNRDLLADGFLGRVLFARSNAGMQKIGSGSQFVRLTTQGAYDALISTLLDSYYTRFDSGPLEVTLDPECREVMVSFQHEIAAQWNACRSIPLQDLLVRVPELAWKMTLVLHAADLGSEAHKTPPFLQTVFNAIRTVRWFSDQAKAMLSPSDYLDPRFRKLLQKLQNRPDREISLRDLKTRHRFSQSEIDGFLVRFPSHIQFDPGRCGRGGRPSPKIRLSVPPEG